MEKKLNLLALDHYGYNLLHCAVQSNNPVTVEMLIKKVPASSDLKDSHERKSKLPPLTDNKTHLYILQVLSYLFDYDLH